MESVPKRKRRKNYLEKGEPFIIPSSTKCRNRTERGRCLEGSIAPGGEASPSPSTSGYGQPTLSTSDDPAEELGDQLETDACFDESLDEWSNMETELDHGDPCQQDDIINDEHDVPGSMSPPAYDEAQCLADSFAEYGDSTLPHSTTTKAEAVALIMSFLTSENLTWSALDKLLRMVNAMFGVGSDVLPRSKYLFRKLWAPKTERVVKYHYYCKGCGSLLDSTEHETTQVCAKCAMAFDLAKVKSDGCFFITMSLQHQIQQIISETNQVLYENLVKLREEAQAPSDIIRDITSGAAYKHLQQTGVLEWTDLTITFNTDGSPLYKSSRSSVWPIQLIINELPPTVRFDHCALAGLWFGSTHPDMGLFMTKFVEEVTSLDTVTWKNDSTVMTSKVHALCCCVDAPARAEVRNHTHFNGYFGCPWCLASGEHMGGSLRYRGTVPDEERTPEGVLRDMKLALQSGVSVNGVKGPSPLATLPNFDLVWGFNVEYMHCVLLGVARQFTEYLLNSTNCHEDFYIGSPSMVAEINQRLLSIRPPHCVTRLPRPVGDRNFWKANEWRQWLLFYCLPCTLGILRQRYWNHLCCLVEAIHILLSQELSQGQLKHAGHLLQRFVAQVERLYKRESCMTYNVHQLLHIQKPERRRD
ncbi:hypothetical protein HPB47_013467 [Ixodes persulcatus]|uniref:Uncharacterized protein n=1 Tax=Ixodes persulcatus TaxID=34615 RepID=A0AC60R1U6_IXOPE|nr:hypothetical protein HPB47_013467 [Ixodes persulcatus]